MRRVWASLLAVWSTLALVGVLAWSQPPARPAGQAAPAVVVVQRAGGSKQLAHVVLLPAGTAAQTTTGSSRVVP